MKKAILFIHGLGCDKSKSTWGEFENLVNTDEDLHYSPFFYEYPSAIVRVLPFAQKKYGNIQELSNGLKTYINTFLDDYEEIALVGHSLGGLIIRQYLLNQKIASQRTKIKKVIFYAVPQEGSELANISSLISFGHRHLIQLCNNSDFLDTLNDHWATSRIDVDFEFKVVVAIEDKVVSPQSAKSNFRHLDPERVPGKGHRSIVKPDNKDDYSYRILKKFLCETIRISRDRPQGALLFEEWLSKDDVGPFFPDAMREQLIHDLRIELVQPRTTVRLIGLSGLGKTRAAIEALKELTVEQKNSILYIDVAGEHSILVAHLNKWVSEGYSGILVADNCSVSLHEHLYRAVSRPESKLSLLTLDSDLQTSGNCKYIELDRLDDVMIKKMLKYNFGDTLPDVDTDRVVSYAKGFPQMAVLIAEARINEEPDVGKLTDDLIAHKLLWGATEGRNATDERILIGCSLFDRFGLEDEASDQFQYIATDIVHIDQDEFYECVKRFIERGLIDKRGRYAQLVPIPLAIRLAAQWWNRSTKVAQRDLIDNLPESMIESFCNQIEKLDFLPEVKTFTSGLCGPQGPFGQAEVILSDRGSRFFRSFVIINPDATSSALSRIVTPLDHEQLLSISDDTRRNLVWALEMLCYHPSLFEESAWVLFLLAKAENETWSNNATGIFSQLFRVNLSGTGAGPEARVALLKRALKLDDEQADIVILEALEEAINTHGGSRTVGAEYQGSKAPLEEWKATIWQEIFDYWEVAFNILIEMLDRGVKQKVIDIIGNSIRGFVNRGRIEMLDTAIRKVIEVNGIYWPTALDSIKNTLEYDAKGMKPEGIEALNTWADLLNPRNANLEQKLKIIVIDPPWEHYKDDNGEYIDVAAENAKTLAQEVSKELEKLYKHVPLLLIGEQRQSYVFGHQLIVDLKEYNDIVDLVLTSIKNINSPNINFCLGIFNGVFKKSEDSWNNRINQIINDENLVKYYPDFIRTGKINKNHLDSLLLMTQQGVLPSNSANVLSYGRVADEIPSNEIIDFCLKLSVIDDIAAWTALHVIFMYCHGNGDRFEEAREALKILVTNVNLGEGSDSSHSEIYHWETVTKKLLEPEDNNFALAVCEQILKTTDEGFNHSHVWHSIKPLLTIMMEKYGEHLWPIFGRAVISASSLDKYWIQQLLVRDNSFSNKKPSVISVLPIDLVISWCYENKEVGPLFVAGCINIFEIVDDVKKPTDLFVALLENFGENKDVRGALSSNLGSGGWSGSLVPYLESDKRALSPLLSHSNNKVRLWVKEYLGYLDKKIDYESMRDDEQILGIY